MGQVTVTVNGRTYAIGCDDGNEDHVRSLGAYLDSRVSELAQSVGQVGEARLLLMAALTVSDDLTTLVQEQQGLRQEVEELRAGLQQRPDRESLSKIINRLERVAEKLENA